MIFIGFASYSFLQLFSPLSSPEKPPVKLGDSISTWSINTGTTSTWSLTRDEYIKTLTGTWLSTIESKVSYVLSFWERNHDFVTVTPHIQDVILWKIKETNNILLQAFIQKYQYPLQIDKNRTWYLVIQTQKRVSNSKDMILAVNGMRLWSFHKTLSLDKFMSDESDDPTDSLYIFPVNSIDIAQRKWIVDLTTFDPLNMAVVIWENNNTVTSLSVVYTNEQKTQ